MNNPQVQSPLKKYDILWIVEDAIRNGNGTTDIDYSLQVLESHLHWIEEKVSRWDYCVANFIVSYDALLPLAIQSSDIYNSVRAIHDKLIGLLSMANTILETPQYIMYQLDQLWHSIEARVTWSILPLMQLLRDGVEWIHPQSEAIRLWLQTLWARYDINLDIHCIRHYDLTHSEGYPPEYIIGFQRLLDQCNEIIYPTAGTLFAIDIDCDEYLTVVREIIEKIDIQKQMVREWYLLEIILWAWLKRLAPYEVAKVAH